MNPITQLPPPFTRVEIFFHQAQLGINGHHDGIWNGERWQFRKTNTKDEYVTPPSYIKIRGWAEIGNGRPK